MRKDKRMSMLYSHRDSYGDALQIVKVPGGATDWTVVRSSGGAATVRVPHDQLREVLIQFADRPCSAVIPIGRTSSLELTFYGEDEHAGEITLGLGTVVVPDMREIRTALEGWRAECAAPPPPSADLKPRGVKRQWWLMPLDALTHAVGDPATATAVSLGEAVSEYQAVPGAASAALCVRAGLGALCSDERDANGALDVVVQVFEHGAAKYDPDNWRRAAEDRDAFRREYLSAMCRHAFTSDTIDLDHALPDGTPVKGSGLPHAAHFTCTALMVLWHEMRWARGE